jgi:hypothetical protein
MDHFSTAAPQNLQLLFFLFVNFSLVFEHIEKLRGRGQVFYVGRRGGAKPKRATNHTYCDALLSNLHISNPTHIAPFS